MQTRRSRSIRSCQCPPPPRCPEQEEDGEDEDGEEDGDDGEDIGEEDNGDDSEEDGVEDGEDDAEDICGEGDGDDGEDICEDDDELMLRGMGVMIRMMVRRMVGMMVRMMVKMMVRKMVVVSRIINVSFVKRGKIKQDVYFDCDQESANYDDRSHLFLLGSQARPETSSLRPILYDQCTRFHPVAVEIFSSAPP